MAPVWYVSRVLQFTKGQGVRALLIGLAVVGLAFPAPRASAEGEAPPAGTRIDRVTITGNQRVEEEAIRVQLTVPAGTRTRKSEVDNDIRALYRWASSRTSRPTVTEDNGQWVLTYASPSGR